MIFDYLQLTESSFVFSEDARNEIGERESGITIQLDVAKRHNTKTSELNGVRFRITVGTIDGRLSEAKPEFVAVLLEGSVEYSFTVNRSSDEEAEKLDTHALDTLWLTVRAQMLQEFTLFELPNPPIPLERPGKQTQGNRPDAHS
jgi:hypothetical protein